MKITKRKSGYTIRCTDSDFAMLEGLVTHSKAQAKHIISGPAKAAFTRRRRETQDDLFRVDKDASSRVINPGRQFTAQD